MKRKVTACIWDFDGTIGDTDERNLRVTRVIIEHLTGRGADEFPALQSVEGYRRAHRRMANWREFYVTHLGLTDEQTDEAGKLWTEYQLRDPSPTPVFRGIDQVVETLRSTPHGIVSQNSKRNIAQALEAADLLRYFGCIIGYEEVDLRRQKPAPDGLLQCIEALTAFKAGHIVYIGDHEVDVETAINANQILEQRNINTRIVTVAATYGPHNDLKTWAHQPHFVATDPVEIIDLVSAL